MTAVATPVHVGDLLRSWRQRRRMSQLDLSVEADVSARHLSFVETGRSRPSRELVLHLAEHLEVPLRDRNSLLLAAGYAPAHPRTSLDAPEMTPVRRALDAILAGHEPYPAVIVDHRWDVVTANETALAVLADGVAPALLAPPMNAMRIALHPDGLAARLVNRAEWAAHLLDRLQRQATASGDPELIALLDELQGYADVSAPNDEGDTAGRLFVPLRLCHDRLGELAFFSTIATFGTALDLTLAELAIESFFPADDATAAALHR